MYKSRSFDCLILSSLILWLAACGGGGGSDATIADNAGADAGSASQTDLEPVTFTQEPDSVTQNAYAQFEFAAENAENFECKLDDRRYEPCTSPFVVYPLDVGSHELSVRTVSVGNGSNEPTTSVWTVASIFSDANFSELHPDISSTNVSPDLVSPQSWKGILRINCDFAHSSYDDPIVFPGKDGAAHLHRFYGNTLLDETSDLTSLFTSGESSCQGNALNRSAHWIPALLAPAYAPDTGERLLDDTGEPAWTPVSAVVGNDDEAHEIFYYSAGIDDLYSIQAVPLGLKMIAGNHMGQPGAEQDTAIARWHCQTWESDESSNPQWSTSIPECVAPDRLRMDLFFPSCWNGVDLDSSDHQSHMAYPVTDADSNKTQCPQSHPVPIIRVSFHYAWGVRPGEYDPETKTSRGWRLASDMYDATRQTPGGMSLHGDWFNAWHPEALRAVLETCIHGGLDCHDGNLGTGYRLSGTRPGTQVEPEVHNQGLGL